MRKFKQTTFLMALLAIMPVGILQAQLFEDFETSVPPAGWVQFDNGIGTAEFWQSSTTAYAGSFSAYILYEEVTSGIAEDWLVTPGILITPTTSFLSFYQRQQYTPNYGSIYTIRVSTTSQTNTASFTTIDTQVETDFTTTWSNKVVDLGTYIGQTIYIAFVMENDDGDNWYIDNVELVNPPCFEPTALTANNITTTSADLSWVSNGGGSVWDAQVIPTGNTPIPNDSLVLSSPFYATGLAPATSYDFFIREYCTLSDPLILTAVYDGPLTGGTPKGIELYAIEDIPDLGEYGVGSANNGGGTDGIEFTFPSMSVTAGTYLYLATDSANFANFFGFAPDFVNSTATNVNGDDAIELFRDSVVIDVFGDINLSGTGQPWEYLDGWVYRNSGSLNNYGTFAVADWTYSGINALDAELTNGTAATPVPIGTFTTTPYVSIWSSITFITDCATTQGDSISNPWIISTPAFVDSGSTVICYTNTTGNTSNDVFYQYIVTDPCLESIDVSLCGSDYDSYLRIYDPQANQLTSNDDNCGANSFIDDFPVSPNDTLLIVVEGYSANNGFYLFEVIPNYTVIAPLTVYNQTNVLCAGDSTGSVAVGNGDPSLTYLWDANAGSQTDSIAVNLSAGTYVVSASNANGCAVTDTVTVTDLYPAIVASTSPANVLCNGDSTGMANLSANGGAGTLNIDWGIYNPAMLPAGTFTYTITDSVGCTVVDSVTINEPTAIALSAVGTDESLGNDGSIDLTVTGGTSPYTYAWNNGAGTSEDPSGLAGNTTYMVTVTDDNGCTDTLSITLGSTLGIGVNGDDNGITIYPNPSTGNFNITFEGMGNEKIVMDVISITGQVIESLQLTTGDVNAVNLEGIAPGHYILRFTNAQGSSQRHISIVK